MEFRRKNTAVCGGFWSPINVRITTMINTILIMLLYLDPLGVKKNRDTAFQEERLLGSKVFSCLETGLKGTSPS